MSMSKVNMIHKGYDLLHLPGKPAGAGHGVRLQGKLLTSFTCQASWQGPDRGLRGVSLSSLESISYVPIGDIAGHQSWLAHDSTTHEEAHPESHHLLNTSTNNAGQTPTV